MIRLDRKELIVLAQYIDGNNPKFELNYLYVDATNAVSTNTRVVGIVQHQGQLEEGQEPFFISKRVIDVALKVKGGLSFALSEFSVTVHNDVDIELMTISSKETNLYKFIDYDRIVIKDPKEKIPFVNVEQAHGITAMKKTHLNVKFMPKIKGEWQGHVLFNDNSHPLAFVSADERINVVLMPIVDRLPVFMD